MDAEVGIIGNEFTICWQGRAQVLSVSRVQKALSKWGFSMDDVTQLQSVQKLCIHGHIMAYHGMNVFAAPR